MLPNPNHGWPSDPLTREEFVLIDAAFTRVLSNMLKTTIDNREANQLASHIGELIVNFRLHTVPVPQVHAKFNEAIFNNTVLSGFYLELLDRFVLEIQPITKDVFQRLIWMMAKASASAKAYTKEGRQDQLGSVVMSIDVKSEDVLRVYRDNPWFVVLYFVVSRYPTTEEGQKALKELSAVRKKVDRS